MTVLKKTQLAISALLILSACEPKEIKVAVTIITSSCDPSADPFAGVSFLRVRVTGTASSSSPGTTVTSIDSAGRVSSLNFNTTTNAVRSSLLDRSIPAAIPTGFGLVPSTPAQASHSAGKTSAILVCSVSVRVAEPSVMARA